MSEVGQAAVPGVGHAAVGDGGPRRAPREGRLVLVRGSADGQHLLLVHELIRRDLGVCRCESERDRQRPLGSRERREEKRTRTYSAEGIRALGLKVATRADGIAGIVLLRGFTPKQCS